MFVHAGINKRGRLSSLARVSIPRTHRESTYAHLALLLHQGTALHHVEFACLGVSLKACPLPPRKRDPDDTTVVVVVVAVAAAAAATDCARYTLTPLVLPSQASRV